MNSGASQPEEDDVNISIAWDEVLFKLSWITSKKVTDLWKSYWMRH